MVHSAAHRPRFLAPGDKLGKYELIRQIAVGGMAELYLARTLGIEGFEKLVVVKRILPQFANNASFVNMFINEARLAATLHHPNIAQVYDIGQEGTDYFFAMEYIHGEDLGRMVASATDNGVPISLDVALTLIAGLCAGLHYAHEKVGSDGKPLNVVHRDVSPSNVLVSYDGAVKLVDFGIARAGSQPSTTRGGLKGKIGYMSPEQCRGRDSLDRRSDIYSIAALLYELTTGRLPFIAESEYGVLNQIVNNDAPPPSTLVPSYPPALEKIVLKALARDREQRYATSIELQGDIEDFAHENRLRISPLVLARLMGTLFPQRLEEWDSARAQGAFFVEQHVVRTLIESGKTGSDLDATGIDDTSVTAPPEPDAEPTNVQTLVQEMPRARTAPPQQPTPPVPVQAAIRPTPLPLRPPTPTPLPPPGAVPIVNPFVGGKLVSSAGSYAAAPASAPPLPDPSIGDVTERVRVRVPTPATANSDTSLLVVRERSKLPLIVVGAGVVAAAIATVIVLAGGDPATPRSTAEAPAPAVAPPAPEPEPMPAAQPEPEPEPAPEPEPEPVKAVEPDPEPPPQPAEPPKPDVVVEEPKPAPPKPAVKPKAQVRKPKPVVKPKPVPKQKPEPKPEPKEPAKWNADSPFMPVRPDKK